MDDSEIFSGLTVVPPTDEASAFNDSSTSFDAAEDDFDLFYRKNESMIEACMNAGVLDMKAAEVELLLSSFPEMVELIFNGLGQLAQVHPGIAAVVDAFRNVISLELSRRDNDRKIVVIMLEMRNMMCAMFQLRELKHAHVRERETHPSRSNLERLLKAITEDIYFCGNDIDCYRKKNVGLRIIKSKDFEKRFKTHVQNFAKRRAEIQTAITAYIARAIDHVVSGITTVSDKQDQFFQELMRRFDTLQEKRIFLFFEKNKSIDTWISRNDLLDAYLALTGDVLPDRQDAEAKKADDRRQKSREVLMREMGQDLEDLLKRNMQHFENLLTIHRNNQERADRYHVETHSKLDQLLNSLRSHARLDDPDVRRIWRKMGLKTSVKAKTFVLTFRDHYPHDGHTPPPTAYPASTISPNPASAVKIREQSLSVFTTNVVQTEEDAEDWLLNYVDVSHVRPIVEAMDTDGSGFISVKEINAFASARPKEWSLLQWMVYWAAGWHITITQYREKIYDILAQMHELLPILHPANRVDVDEYLNGWAMVQIEGILRSTNSASDRRNSQLSALAQFYADTQESALRKNLEVIKYVIPSVDEANLVAQGARVESWIYPLLYLLLERHLAVIKLGRTHVLNDLEIDTHWVSLDVVLKVFLQRKSSLTAIFSQIDQNVGNRFESFAYGMFYASYMASTELSPVKNSFSTMRGLRPVRDLVLEMCDEAHHPASDTSILALEKTAAFEFTDLDIDAAAVSVALESSQLTAHPLEGYWSIICFNADGDLAACSLFHLVITVASTGRITGSGEAYFGPIQATGVCVSSGSEERYHFSVQFEFKSPRTIYSFEGGYDSARNTVSGVLRQHPMPIPVKDPVVDAGVDAVEDTNIANVDADGGRDPIHGDTPGNTADGARECNTSDTLVDNVPDAVNGINDDSTSHVDIESAQPNASVTKKPVIEEICSELGGDVEADAFQVTPVVPAQEDMREGADDPDKANVKNVRDTTSQVFFMRRTPADLYRIRRKYNLDNETNPSARARNRWGYLKEVIEFRAQVKNMSWAHVRARFLERRLYIDLFVAHALHLLPVSRVNFMHDLTAEYGPFRSRLYEAMGAYLLSKGYPFKTGLGISCDFCGYPIVCDRYRCITCMKEDLSNQIDLCVDTPECIENESANPRDDFVHSPSHTLLRQKCFIHKIHLSSLITHCRTLSEKVKKRFRTLDEDKKAAKTTPIASGRDIPQSPSQSEVKPMICVCCKEEVSLPCWICATCVAETAVCMKCELKQAAVVIYEDRIRAHSHNHLLLRINDSQEVHSREIDIIRLQREISRLTDDFKTLDQKVTTHLKAGRKRDTAWRKLTMEGKTVGITRATDVVDAVIDRGDMQDGQSQEDASNASERTDPGDDESSTGQSESNSPFPTNLRVLPEDDTTAQAETNDTAGSILDLRGSQVDSQRAGFAAEVALVPAMDSPSVETPMPTRTQFLESFTAEPAQGGRLENGDTLDRENGETMHLERRKSTEESNSRQQSDYLDSIDSRINSLDDRMSSVENHLREILSLLRQTRA